VGGNGGGVDGYHGMGNGRSDVVGSNAWYVAQVQGTNLRGGGSGAGKWGPNKYEGCMIIPNAGQARIRVG